MSDIFVNKGPILYKQEKVNEIRVLKVGLCSPLG